MIIKRLAKGEIFFDEFNSLSLDPKWIAIPNNPSRYSLSENPGFLTVHHGSEDITFLLDEVEEYVIDMKNDYVPLSSAVQIGLVVYNGPPNNLEFLEYYEITKPPESVYQYLRLIKQNKIYTMYGKNNDITDWELVASVEFTSAGFVGIVCKGPNVPGQPPLKVDFIRMYKNFEVLVLNVAVDYTVELREETTNNLIDSRKVTNPYNGASLFVRDIPNIRAYFKVFDETDTLVFTSPVFDVCGGDIYYCGTAVNVFVDGNNLGFDGEHFLGYFVSNKIDFEIRIENPNDVSLTDVTISAVQHELDTIGFTLVEFSLISGGIYTDTLNIGTLLPTSDLTLYGRITSDPGLIPSETDPYKFNLKVTNG